MSVQDTFRSLSIAHDFMVSCGDTDAIVGAELKATLLVRFLVDFVTSGGTVMVILTEEHARQTRQGRWRVCGQPRSDVQAPCCTVVTQRMRMC